MRLQELICVTFLKPLFRLLRYRKSRRESGRIVRNALGAVFSMLFCLTLPLTHLWAQSVGVAVVGSTIISTNQPLDIELNYFMFQERVKNPWTCYYTGSGGYVPGEGNSLGLNLTPYTGSGAMQAVSSPPYQYQIGMYLAPGLDSAYTAALNGCAEFDALSYTANGHFREDLRRYGEVLGAGPPTWMSISGGYSTSTNSVLLWGPQLEFIDAVRDSTDPNPSLAISFCGNCTAARYANLKYDRPDWNVFDLRQGLRQASTFYDSSGWGWREDGGYGFPQVPNQVGDNFKPAIVTTNKFDLEAGPPLQPIALAKSGPRGPQIIFRWYNFRQSTFDHTRIKIGNIIIDAPGTNWNYAWDVSSLWPLAITNAEFFTVLGGTNNKTSPPEIYTQVPIPPILAAPHFLSDTQFQFQIFGFPCQGITDEPVLVYSSSNLLSWDFVQQQCINSGKGTFTDNDIAGVNYRFYRIVQRGLHSQTLGFTRLVVPGGQSAVIANQFDRGDNSLGVIFTDSTITSTININKLNPVGHATYEPEITWSNPGLRITPGEAAWLVNQGPDDCIVRFAGDVREGALLKSVGAGTNLISFMLPIDFGSYPRYERNDSTTDLLGPGAVVSRWNGTAFVDYFYDPQRNAWVPDLPPIQPGEGFLIGSGGATATNSPAPWTVAFSGYATASYGYQLLITGIQISGLHVIVTFTSQPGRIYQLEYCDDPTLGTWYPIDNPFPANGDVSGFVHRFGAGAPRRFYRLAELQ